jgi:hypothetical protein
MKATGKFVGRDVHKDTTVIAVPEAGHAGGVRLYGPIGALKKSQSSGFVPE